MGRDAFLFAMIVGRKVSLFASPRVTVRKPLHLRIRRTVAQCLPLPLRCDHVLTLHALERISKPLLSLEIDPYFFCAQASRMVGQKRQDACAHLTTLPLGRGLCDQARAWLWRIRS